MVSRGETVSKGIVALVCAFALVSCEEASAPGSAAAPGTASGPIVGGETETGWAGVGALTAEYPLYGYIGSFCTGTLIAPSWVLTAAHCLQDNPGQPAPDPHELYFYVGNDARPRAGGTRPPGDFFQGQQFFVHPQYNELTLDNDIALIRLAQPASGVPTYEANTSHLNANGLDAFYVGFGATEGVDGAGSGVKRSTYVEISWVYQDVFTSDFESSGTCFGDSGGPAFLNIGGADRVVGVTSAGVDCNPNVDPSCDPDPCRRPSISVRVDRHAAWIADVREAPAPDCQSNPGICACAEACLPNGQCDNGACQTGSCADTFECFGDCGDDACATACYEAATASAQQEVDALLGCMEARCGAHEGDAFNDCLEAECAPELGACFPAVTGTDTCEGVVDCMSGCSDSDQACFSACFQDGSEQAQGQYEELVACIDDHCANVPDSEYGQCVGANCDAEYSACFPPANCPIQGGGCDAGEACYPSTGAVNDCFPSNGKALGDDCADSDTVLDCGDGAICLEGTCEAFCGSDVHCGAGVVCEQPLFQGVQGVGYCGCQDADGDGYCADVDCDDGDPNVHPGASERCDGRDTNCDGTVDEGCEDCVDEDGDGYCADVDCDDSDPNVHPGAAERCDGRDTNCNGTVDEGCDGCVDADGDGYCAEVDCDDTDPNVHPGAPEICGDGLDNSCDGTVDGGCDDPPGQPGTTSGGGSGCASGGVGAGLWWLAALGLLAWGGRRRRAWALRVR